MVFLTNVVFSVHRGSRRFVRRQLVDSLRLHVTGGSGGMGLPKYGGIGGKGGDVCAIGKDGITLKDTLRSVREKRIKASNGENSHRNCIIGPNGEDVTIEVPIGITIFNENGSKMGEINSEDEKIVLSKGGCGGTKVTSFSGQRGESHSVVLDLKIIADIGLVGFPNAGKSTILSIISNAKPKISSYPFTTIHPNIGVVQYPDLREITAADLPGLIEGAHINFGMGHRFLKHVERTKLLLVVVDISGFRLSFKYRSRSCLETIVLLNKELELYREDLLDKPAVLVINKMDKKNSDAIFNDVSLALNDYKAVLSEVPEQIKPLKPLNFQRVLSMSAREAKFDEIDSLKNVLRDVLDSMEVYDEISGTSLVQKLTLSQTVRGPVLT